MNSSIRHKQSISWTFLRDAMVISAKEIPKNHTDKERFAAASSCIVTGPGILTFLFPRKPLLPFLYIVLVIFKLICSIHLFRQSVQHTAKSLWNTLLKNNYYNYRKLICQFLDKYLVFSNKYLV